MVPMWAYAREGKQLGGCNASCRAWIGVALVRMQALEERMNAAVMEEIPLVAKPGA